MLKFKEFILEAFSINECDYGTDLYNKQFGQDTSMGTPHLYTYMKYNTLYFKILYDLRTGNFQFKSSDKPPDENDFRGDRRALSSEELDTWNKSILQQNLYSRVLYILSELVRQYDIKLLYIFGLDKTKETYDKLFKFKKFRELLHSMGFYPYKFRNASHNWKRD